jgi:ferritin-like metal-binding protein YciE
MNSLRLEDRFLHELKVIHSLERQIGKALPEVVGAVHGEEMRFALQANLAMSKAHFARLTRLRKEFGINLKGHTCEVTATEIQKARALIVEEGPGPVRDLGLVAAVQAMEHHTLTRYTAAHILALQLGLEHAASLLADTVTEKKAEGARLLTVAGTLVTHTPSGREPDFNRPTGAVFEPPLLIGVRHPSGIHLQPRNAGHVNHFE